MKIAIHITHEAVQKIGGIGSVISGLCSSDVYKNYFDKTVLYGPLFYNPGDIFSKLGKGGKVLYSNRDYFDEGNFDLIFKPIIQKYNINIVYGKRLISNEFNPLKNIEADILLIDINGMNSKEIEIFKFKLWEKYKIESLKFENNWDYEQYLRIAIPYIEILKSLYNENNEFYHFSHEYMGICSALSTLFEKKFYKSNTIYYAHEISPVRSIIESKPGHDIMFYLKMEDDIKKGISLLERYPEEANNPRAVLVKKTVCFDLIFAVSDLVKKEYIYLNPEIDEKKIKVVYNGIPIRYIDKKEKNEARSIVKEYCKSIFNFEPDYIFSHVGRMVLSKGFWRDFSFLFYLDEKLKSIGATGFFILISSLIGTGRESSDVFNMEKDYGWPAHHREGWPDLVGMEIDIYNFLNIFNAKSRSIKAIFLNQFGFSRRKCGFRLDEKAEFIHLRASSDAEFGFSIYEPFGIAQLETIPFGGFAFLSTTCGSYYLLKNSYEKNDIKPFLGVDFILEGQKYINQKGIDPIDIDIDLRTEIENRSFYNMKELAFNLLPKDDNEREKFLSIFQGESNKIGWESISNKIIEIFKNE